MSEGLQFPFTWFIRKIWRSKCHGCPSITRCLSLQWWNWKTNKSLPVLLISTACFGCHTFFMVDMNAFWLICLFVHIRPTKPNSTRAFSSSESSSTHSIVLTTLESVTLFDPPKPSFSLWEIFLRAFVTSFCLIESLVTWIFESIDVKQVSRNLENHPLMGTLEKL